MKEMDCIDLANAFIDVIDDANEVRKNTVCESRDMPMEDLSLIEKYFKEGEYTANEVLEILRGKGYSDDDIVMGMKNFNFTEDQINTIIKAKLE
jgi:hypothetical protein